MRRIARTAIGLAVAGALVSGCTPLGPPMQTGSPAAATPGATATPDGSSATEQAPGIAVRPRDGVSRFAIISGTLRFLDGCLVLDDGDGLRYPVFEEGSVAWDGTTLTYLGDAYPLGSQVSWGGGRVDDWPHTPADYGLPATCPTKLATLVNGPRG